MNKMQTSEYLVGKVLRSHIAVTIMVTLTATLSIVINGLVVAQGLGADALVSFGLATPMLILLSAIAGVFSNGGSIRCARYIGLNDVEGVRRNFSTVFFTSVIVGAVYGLALFFGADMLGDAFGGTPAIRGLTADYIRAIGLTAVPMLLTQDLLNYLRMDNNQALTTVGIVATVVVNTVFALYSVAFTDMGMFGIGMAMCISNIVGVAICMFHFLRKDRLLGIAKPKGVKTELVSICMAGLPTAINRGSQTLKNFVLNSFLLSIAGTTAVMTLSVQTNVYQFLIAISTGFGILVAMLCGMFYGERDTDAIRATLRRSCSFGFLLSSAVGAILFILAEPIAMMFIKTGGDLGMATTCLRLFAFSQPTSTLCLILLYMYQSMGNLMLSNVISLTRGALYVILFSMAFAPVFGLEMVWLSAVVADVLSMLTIIVVLRIKTGRFPRRAEDFIMFPEGDDRVEDIFNASVSNDIDEVMDISRRVEEDIVRHGIDREKAQRVALCIEEMACNVVDHAFCDGKTHFMDIRVMKIGDDLVFRLRDDGKRFNPLNAELDGHLGIKVVKATCKSIDYRYSVHLNNTRVVV
ncbi:MAG: ATP-binding protein [archaeon]|nr:ATP-binding protein [archaeon]